MKKDINLFGDEFEKIIFDCQKEESKVRELQQKYVDALETLDANNDKRRELLDAIRLAKEKEIDSEIEETKKKMTENEARHAELRRRSCAENGHDFGIVASNYNYGEDQSIDKGIYKVTYECTICGERKIVCQESNESIFPKNPKAHTNYLGNRLCKTGHTLEDTLSSEYQKLESYLQYLESLTIELCHIFGHSVDEKNECRCCGMYVGKSYYEESQGEAVYKGIAYPAPIVIPAIGISEFIINSHKDLVLNLPPYREKKVKRVVARVKRK